MKKLLIVIILFTVSYNAAIAQEEEVYNKRQFQAKTYLSMNYQKYDFGGGLNYRAFFTGVPILGVAWKRPNQINFQELQLVSLNLTNANSSGVRDRSQSIEMRYSYNFAFSLGSGFNAYIGAGLEQQIGHSNLQTQNTTQFALRTSLIGTPGVQFDLNDKWVIDFNIPMYIAEYQYFNVKNNTTYSGSDYETIVGQRFNFRLGVGYTF